MPLAIAGVSLIGALPGCLRTGDKSYYPEVGFQQAENAFVIKRKK
jgi:hypothetical protein